MREACGADELFEATDSAGYSFKIFRGTQPDGRFDKRHSNLDIDENLLCRRAGCAPPELNGSIGAVQEVKKIPPKHFIVIWIHEKNQFSHAGSALNCGNALLSR